MKKYQIAYFGTPYFSANFLEKMLLDKELPIETKFVVTQPDKPVGKNQVFTPTPVKEIAKKYSIEVFEFEFRSWREKINKCDFAFLFAYGGIIPKDLINQPRLGFFNTHPSLLPKYRGPSPMTYPLLLGNTQTGVTFIRLDHGIDHGPILVQKKVSILPSEKRPELEIKLTDVAFELFKDMVNSLIANESIMNSAIPQDDKEATFTKLFVKDDGFIPFSTLQKALKNEPFTFEELPKIISDYIYKYGLIESLHWREKIKNSSKIIYDCFRGLYPWPGIWTLVNINGQQKRLKITDLKLAKPSNLSTFQPAQLEILKVQLEGKNEVDFKTFNKAYKIL